ncbi:hypothetical protein FRB90_004015 [Tulasnella sp. 427]|nr:hypothetical protein FRB90_004015 [Tulasnella sp. 427]
MPVLEIALLHIRTSSGELASTSNDVENPLTPYIKGALHHALHVLRASTPETYPFNLLQQHEDPSYLYIVGLWPSIEAHEAFLPSEENKQLLSSLEGKVGVEWMYHAQIGTSASDDAIVGDVPKLISEAPVIAIGRHGVKGASKAVFEETWRAGSGGLRSFSGREPVGGWRVGRVFGVKNNDGEKGFKEETDEEWVVLSGWDAVERHSAFAGSEEFKKYSKMRPYVVTFDVKHAIKVLSSDEDEKNNSN